ncbi:MAG TPA: abortive infection family protein [Bacillota bacterium]|nr:abortive infection family protein [Bacillota bacterium]
MISEVTRRDILDEIREAYAVYRTSPMSGNTKSNGLLWHGRLDEVSFLKRLYRLKELRSYDSRFTDAEGDIYQHRFNNDDWEECWILEDDRFGLNEGDDETLLRFICEMFHPIVRQEDGNWQGYLKRFNELLYEDDYVISKVSSISGREVFGWKKISDGIVPCVSLNTDDTPIFNTEYILQQIKSMEDAINDSPYDAIGKAKELVESCCKTIIRNCGHAVDETWEFPELSKYARKILRLAPDDVENAKAAKETIKSILGSLGNIPHSIAELRNSYGSGHGKDAKFRGLSPRHARLAADSAKTFINFMWDTYENQYRRKE